MSKYLILLAFAGLHAHAGAQIFLGTADRFAVLAGSTVTNTGSTVVTGDLGVSPGTTITGFPPGQVIGTMYAGGGVPAQAQLDAALAYTVLASLALTQNLSGQDLGGLTLTPGVYRFNSSAQLTGALTLDFQGDPNALFVFQIGSTLTTASAASVQTINAPEECNIFWQVGSSATLGTVTDFKGTIIADQSITLNTGARIETGRALALNAAVTLDTNIVTVDPCVVPEPGGIALLIGTAAISGLAIRRRVRA